MRCKPRAHRVHFPLFSRWKDKSQFQNTYERLCQYWSGQSRCHGRAQRNIMQEAKKRRKILLIHSFLCCRAFKRVSKSFFSPSQISAFFSFSSESHRDNVTLMHNAQTHRGTTCMFRRCNAISIKSAAISTQRNMRRQLLNNLQPTPT